jgi:hypothetical protein
VRRRELLSPDPAGAFVLSLVRPLAFLWRWLGADPRRMLLLLRLRFVISARQPLGPSPVLRGVGVHVALTGMVGFLLLALILMDKDDPGLAMGTGQAFVLLMTAINLAFVLPEFLFDEAEGTVVRPCPVEDRTAVVARALHAGGYMALITAALAGPSVVIGTAVLGPRFGVAFLVASVLNTVLVATLSLFACGLLLRLVGQARFKSAIGWGQALMLVGFYGFQLNAVYLMNWLEAVPMFQERGAWCLAVPPIWGQALYERLSGSGGSWSGRLVLASVVIPALLCWLSLRLVRSGFLEAVSHRGGGAARAPRLTWLDRLGRRLCRTGAERAGWHILAKAGPRDSRFRMRVIPAVCMPVLAGGGLLLRGSDLGVKFLAVAFLYLSVLGLVVLDAVSASERHRASWVYEANPVRSPKALWPGLLRLTFVVTLVVPGLVLGVVLWLRHGPRFWVPTWTGFGVSVLMGTLILPRTSAEWPFSRQPRASGGVEQIGLVMLAFLSLAVVAPVVVLASQHAWAGLPLGAVCLALAWWRFVAFTPGTTGPR